MPSPSLDLLSLPPARPEEERLPPMVVEFLAEARRRIQGKPCPGFAPADYEYLYVLLAHLREEATTFCEWGSGFGVVAGMAEMLGLEAEGVETNPSLVLASRDLLEEFGLHAEIVEGDYEDHDILDFDLVYAYPWPGEVDGLLETFRHGARPGSRILVYHGETTGASLHEAVAS